MSISSCGGRASRELRCGGGSEMAAAPVEESAARRRQDAVAHIADIAVDVLGAHVTADAIPSFEHDDVGIGRVLAKRVGRRQSRDAAADDGHACHAPAPTGAGAIAFVVQQPHSPQPAGCRRSM